MTRRSLARISTAFMLLQIASSPTSAATPSTIPSPDRSLADVKAAAERGDASAQFRLGQLHAKGQGVPHDFVRAVEWYRTAADQGYAEAQLALGLAYRLGNGVRRDDAQAFAWLRKSAAQD